MYSYVAEHTSRTWAVSFLKQLLSFVEESEANITLQLHPKDLSTHYCTSSRRLLVFECDGVLVSQRSFLVPAAAVTVTMQEV
jgi:hypothetical protein